MEKLNLFKKEKLNLPIDHLTQECIREAELVEIKPENRNEKGELLAANGEVSSLQNELHWKMVRTPSFKSWFGDSKIVDRNEEPLVVYRGISSKKEIDRGRPLKPGTSQGGFSIGTGTYFTPYLNFSEKYGETKFFCFLRIKNLSVLGKSEFTYERSTEPEPPKSFGKDFSLLRLAYLNIFKPAQHGAAAELTWPKDLKGAEKYSELTALNDEDIMVIPAPNINLRDKEFQKSLKENAQKTGYNF